MQKIHIGLKAKIIIYRKVNKLSHNYFYNFILILGKFSGSYSGDYEYDCVE